MNRLSKMLSKMLFVMMLVMGLITPVIGSEETSPPAPLHAGEGEETPTCSYGGAGMYNYVPSATFAQTAPCGYLVKFAEAGKWDLTGTVPLETLKAFHYPACKITAAGRIKAQPSCAVVILADSGAVEDGTIWRFTLSRVVAAP